MGEGRDQGEKGQGKGTSYPVRKVCQRDCGRGVGVMSVLEIGYVGVG